MSKAPFVIQKDLTGIAVAYTNKRLIADLVMPRVPVSAQEFKYTLYPLGEAFTVPDLKVGRKGQVGQVETSSSEETDSTDDYGIEVPVNNADIENAATNKMIDPRRKAAELSAGIVLLGREKRVSDLVFDEANYAAANKIVLSGTSQFSDFANSDPFGVVDDGKDAVIMTPNIGIMGSAVFLKLSRHPAMVQAFHGNSGEKGKVPLAFMAEQFGLDELHVGEGYINLSKPGQTAVPVRIWGKHFALIYRDLNADTGSGVTFGLTAQWGGRIGGTIADPDIGLRGGERVRVGESVKELITANDLGYFIEDAVA